ncbi:GyrI-like domain-containing protein [uncultured Croceitalea sp.]|uniref:GyrI-like domain-containing protein n=1 Tax=uncultured Croceitalea sp. TaxID=1798908 RepID=UPI00330623D1
MTTVTKEAFSLVGISTITSNEKGKAAQDIPALWHRLMVENIAGKIPNKTDETIYALYSDYEGDHTQPYKITIGYKVNSLDNIPEDLTVKMIPQSKYAKFTAQGNLTQDAVINKWMEIWNMDLQRTYTTDLEIYDDRAADPTNGVAEILIGVQ